MLLCSQNNYFGSSRIEVCGSCVSFWSSGRGEEVRSKEGHTVLAGAGSPGSAARASRRELGGRRGRQAASISDLRGAGDGTVQ